MPEAPEMLVAESAKRLQLGFASEELGVLLLWNAPNAPDGANIGGYRDPANEGRCDATWETLAWMTPILLHTDFTDSEEPAMDEIRGYQVAAISANNIAWRVLQRGHDPAGHQPHAGLDRARRHRAT